jgi:hypothetical protein
MTFEVWVYEIVQLVTAIGVIFTAISSIYNRYEIRKAARKVDTVVKAASGLSESAKEAKVAVAKAQISVAEVKAAVADVKAAVIANGTK